MPFRALLLVPVLALATTSCAWFRPKPPEYEPVTLPSGVVVQDVVVPEEGAPARLGDLATLHYELRLRDGTLIDSSIERGQPIEIRLGSGDFPRGLEQGVVGMRLFGRRNLVVPPSEGYGAEGKPPDIPDGAFLFFLLELMGLEQGEAVPPDDA
jgi:peptidylprolyl isomerase